MNLSIIHVNKRGILALCGIVLIWILYSANNSGTNVDSKQSNLINLKYLLKIAIKAAENGGKEVVATKDNIEVKSKGLTKEGLQDSVTTADFLSHCSMVTTLKHTFPHINVISEEAKAECDENQPVDFAEINNDYVNNLDDVYMNEDDVTVWIDPLDATHEYTEKLYEYVTTMVCIAVNGKPIIGIIHKPFSKNTSWAWVDNAHSPDLPQKKHSTTSSLRITISRSHGGKIKEILKKNYKNLESYQVVVAAGAGYKALEVAYGNVDAYLHVTQIKKWDICAGNAILNALGGKMTTKYNEEIDYSSISSSLNERGLVATLESHELFLKILKN